MLLLVTTLSFIHRLDITVTITILVHPEFFAPINARYQDIRAIYVHQINLGSIVSQVFYFILSIPSVQRGLDVEMWSELYK